jgi:hypothetical protein
LALCISNCCLFYQSHSLPWIINLHLKNYSTKGPTISSSNSLAVSVIR